MGNAVASTSSQPAVSTRSTLAPTSWRSRTWSTARCGLASIQWSTPSFTNRSPTTRCQPSEPTNRCSSPSHSRPSGTPSPIGWSPPPTTAIFRGPKFLGPESERYRSQPEAAVTAGLDLCSGCKLCEVTCPSQVSIQEYIRRAQNKGAAEKGRTLRDWVLGHTRLLSRFGSMTAPLANLGNRNPLVRWAMERVLGIHHKRPLPRYQWLTFERSFKRHRSLPKTPQTLPSHVPRGSRGPAGPRTVAYFYGCWVNYNERRVGEQVVAILERNGIEVIVPKQQCCGIPAVANANMDLAHKYG